MLLTPKQLAVLFTIMVILTVAAVMSQAFVIYKKINQPEEKKETHTPKLEEFIYVEKTPLCC